MGRGRGRGRERGGVFKLAGARSLNKSKSKAVRLGLRDIKKKVEQVDAQFLELNKSKKTEVTKPAEQVTKPASQVTTSAKQVTKPAEQVTKKTQAKKVEQASDREETRKRLSDTTDLLVHMDV